MTDQERTLQTYRMERWRSAFSGVIETAGSTYFLLIAVKWLEAGSTAKALIAAGGSVGLLVSPLTVNLAARFGWRPARAAAGLFLVGALACLTMTVWPAHAVYVLGSMLAMLTPSAAIPLMTQVYQDNYPAERRGQLYARAFMLRIGATILFGAAAGAFLAPKAPEWATVAAKWVNGAWDAREVWGHPEKYRGVLGMIGVAFLGGAAALGRIPSKPLRGAAGSHPLHALRYVGEDRLFRQALIAWMLMGFANLMMLPMRVEYLANPRFGLAKTAAEVSLLTVVIPNMARLLLSPVWGWVFDRANFFALRATLNLGFAIGILTFFISSSDTGLVWAAIVFGISNAGGDVAWGLWVTKFAPAERVADYMSVHTFFTGIRGVLAPLAAFHAIQRFSLSTMGWASAALILFATLFLVPEIRGWKPLRKGDPVGEEVTD